MGKLTDISSNPTLVNFAQRSAQQAIQPVANFMAPPVEVAIPTGRYKEYTAKSRFRVPNTRRPLGGPATIIGQTAEDKLYNCEPHALDYPVDQIEKLAEQDLVNSMMEGATICSQAAALAHEKAVVDAAFAAVPGSTVDWGSAVDPIAEIDEAVLTVLKAAKFGSLMGIGIVLGAGMFKFLKNHPKVSAKFVVGNKSANYTATPTLDNFGELILGQPECRASFMVYDDAAEGLAENIKFVMDGSMLVFARMANPTRFDPSFMKTFRLMGQWMVPGSYTSTDGRVEFAKFDWSEDVKLTNAAAAVRFNLPT